MVLSKILVWWESIKSIGAGDNQEENAFLSLINQMGVLGTIVFFIFFPVSLIIEGLTVSQILPFVFGLSILFTLIFNYLQKVQYSKYIITIVHPLLVSVFMILTGGDFGEECIMVISIFMIYTLYYRSPKRVITLYVVTFLLYFGAELFLLTHGSILTTFNNPLDESIGFVMSAIWIMKIIEVYRKQIKININERLQLINTLQRKNNRLEKTSAELEQFTYIASHDLKTPLRTIVSFLGLIKRDISRQKYHSLLTNLDFARTGADQINILLQDILSYSRIMGEEQEEDVKIDLNDILDEIKYELQDFTSEKGGKITSGGLPVILGNHMVFSTLFKHFIRNGIQYNEHNMPTVHISAKVKGKTLILRFEDNGIGIEEQYFEKIFCLFKRLHTHVYYKGTGLGLGLCRKIIDNMEGSVRVSSTLSIGSTFIVSLPVKKVISSPLNIKESLATAEL